MKKLLSPSLILLLVLAQTGCYYPSYIRVSELPKVNFGPGQKYVTVQSSTEGTKRVNRDDDFVIKMKNGRKLVLKPPFSFTLSRDETAVIAVSANHPSIRIPLNTIKSTATKDFILHHILYGTALTLNVVMFVGIALVLLPFVGIGYLFGGKEYTSRAAQ